MKKFLGILFLLIIVAAGVCAYLFPGIPYKYKCTNELQTTDSLWNDTPGNLQPISGETADYSNFGLKLTAWDDMKPVRTDSKDSAMWQNGDEIHRIGISEEHLSESEDFLDRTGISHEALDKYCRAVEKTTPESEYEFTKLVMSLNMEDFDIHNFKNSKTFYQLMKCKNESYIDESDPARYYSVDGVGFRGYLNTIETPDGYTAHVFLYPEREKRTRYIIKISTENFGDIFTIADSIKLT